MFVSVSDNLPKTSYIKMVDIWLVTTLCIPFIEVLYFFIKKQALLHKRESDVNFFLKA